MDLTSSRRPRIHGLLDRETVSKLGLLLPFDGQHFPNIFPRPLYFRSGLRNP